MAYDSGDILPALYFVILITHEHPKAMRILFSDHVYEQPTVLDVS